MQRLGAHAGSAPQCAAQLQEKLALNNNKISERKNSSGFGLSLLKRPPSSMPIREGKLVSVVSAAGDPASVPVFCYCGLCCCQRPCERLWPVLPTEAMLVSVACAPPRGHVDVCVLCSPQRPCWCLWPVFPPKATVFL